MWKGTMITQHDVLLWFLPGRSEEEMPENTFRMAGLSDSEGPGEGKCCDHKDGRILGGTK
jgi:hypothetical protein